MVSALRRSNEDLSKRIQKENELRHEQTKSLDAFQKEVRYLEIKYATRDKFNTSKSILDYERDVKGLKRDLSRAQDKET